MPSASVGGLGTSWQGSRLAGPGDQGRGPPARSRGSTTRSEAWARASAYVPSSPPAQRMSSFSGQRNPRNESSKASIVPRSFHAGTSALTRGADAKWALQGARLRILRAKAAFCAQRTALKRATAARPARKAHATQSESQVHRDTGSAIRTGTDWAEEPHPFGPAAGEGCPPANEVSASGPTPRGSRRERPWAGRLPEGAGVGGERGLRRRNPNRERRMASRFARSRQRARSDPV